MILTFILFSSFKTKLSFKIGRMRRLFSSSRKRWHYKLFLNFTTFCGNIVPFHATLNINISHWLIKKNIFFVCTGFANIMYHHHSICRTNKTSLFSKTCRCWPGGQTAIEPGSSHMLFRQKHQRYVDQKTDMHQEWITISYSK